MLRETLAHYRIKNRLGAGGMGEVFRVEDTRLGRDVALKVLLPEFAQDQERLRRFRREAQLPSAPWISTRWLQNRSRTWRWHW